MNRKILLISYFLLFTNCPEVFSGGAGTTGSQFLKLGIGARPVSMGEANAGLSDDVNAVWWNPAGLNQLEGREITAMHTVWFENIFFSNVAYCQKGFNGVVGGAIGFLSAGRIDKIDKSGNPLNESFTSYDIALTLSYAKIIRDVLSGISMKLVSSRIEDESAVSLAIDMGCMYKVLKDRLSFGLVLQNLGSGPKFMKKRDPLPINIKIGSAYRPFSNMLTLVFDVNVPFDHIVNFNMGGEYTYSIGENIKIIPRAGYKTKTITDLDIMSGLSAGFGFVYSDLAVDYVWVPYWELGNTHRISMSYKFDNKKT